MKSRQSPVSSLQPAARNRSQVPGRRSHVTCYLLAATFPGDDVDGKEHK